jgi:hypothetical protein
MKIPSSRQRRDWKLTRKADAAAVTDGDVQTDDD